MSQKTSLLNENFKNRRDRSISSTPRSSHYTKPQLQTSALIYCALQVTFLSFLLSYYGISASDVFWPALSWTSENLQKIPLVDSIVKFANRTLDTLISFIISDGTSGSSTETSTISSKKSSEAHKAELNAVTILEKFDDSLPVLTKEQLSFFDGTRPSKGTYLAILGRIYDVQKGAKHYGPGGGYHFFAGRDATRAFVSGDFSEQGLVDDVEGLGNQDLLGIFDWIKFYEKDYELVGYLQGTYYDARGNPTSKLKEVIKLIESALTWKDMQEEEAKVFPPCNSEWRKDSGGRVWCTKKSGGIAREWSGVPRKLFNPESKSYRCVCVKNFGSPLSNFPGKDESNGHGDLDNPNLKEYEGCKPTSNTCRNDSS